MGTNIQANYISHLKITKNKSSNQNERTQNKNIKMHKVTFKYQRQVSQSQV
jgi:hypothetical protein